MSAHMTGVQRPQRPLCLITGAGRGIGAAIALAVAGPQVKLALHYNRSREEAQAVAEQCRRQGSETSLYQADLTRGEDTRALMAALAAREGAVSWLVNNAGVDCAKPLDACGDDDWERVMGLNLRAPFWLCRQVIPGMVRQKYGRIVNIASVWGVNGASCEAIYAASKGGLIALSKSLALELGPSGITVNCIAPGAVDTDMMRGDISPEEIKALCDEIPARRMARPEEVAYACRWLLSDEASYMNGHTLVMDGGWKA